MWKLKGIVKSESRCSSSRRRGAGTAWQVAEVTRWDIQQFNRNKTDKQLRIPANDNLTRIINSPPILAFTMIVTSTVCHVCALLLFLDRERERDLRLSARDTVCVCVCGP